MSIFHVPSSSIMIFACLRLYQRSLLYNNICSYEFSPILTLSHTISWHISLSGMIFCGYEHFPHTICIPYLLACDHCLLQYFSLSNICSHELFPARSLSHTMFWNTILIRHFFSCFFSSSFSLTSVCHYTRRTSPITYDLLAYELFSRTLAIRSLKISSHAGNRTRAFWVKARYPSH